MALRIEPLPVLRNAAVVPRSASAAAGSRASIGAPGQRVLVADDNAQVRSALCRFLTLHGLGVVESVDGPSTVEVFRRERPDLVLLDIDMPGFDGFEACRRMKGDPDGALVPVLFLTALDSPEGRQKGAEVGGDGYLIKPVQLAEMIARVRTGLRQKQLTDALGTAEATLRAQAAQVEACDPAAVGRGRRMAQLSGRLAERLGLPLELRRTVARAAEVHDIGMIVVPDAVRLKTGPLTETEWEMVRRHPVAGEQLCAPFREYRAALPIIRGHHERRDGTGYPDGLVGDAIPLGARIIQMVDAYDAMTTTRPHAEAVAPRVALEAIEADVRNGRWDAEVLASFRAILAAGPASPPSRAAAAPVPC
jgi:putative two-component system response regulator